MCKTGLDTDVMILITALYVYYDMSVSPRVMLKKKEKILIRSSPSRLLYNHMNFFMTNAVGQEGRRGEIAAPL